MAYTQQQLIDLEKAIAQGATSVQYQDKRVSYRSLDEMRRIRDEMIAQLTPTKSKPSRAQGIYSKGLN